MINKSLVVQVERNDGSIAYVRKAYETSCTDHPATATQFAIDQLAEAMAFITSMAGSVKRFGKPETMRVVRFEWEVLDVDLDNADVRTTICNHALQKLTLQEIQALDVEDLEALRRCGLTGNKD